MACRTTTVATYLVTLPVLIAISLNSAIAARPAHYSHREWRRLIANAKTPDEYQTLATHFHYRELFCKARAQRELDDFANCASKYPMATKVLSRAEVTARLYGDYQSKAGENAKLAARYDEPLGKLGIVPASESPTTVSVKHFHHSFAEMRALR